MRSAFLYFALLCIPALSVAADDDDSGVTKYAGDQDSLDGDILKLKTNSHGFESLDPRAPGTFCAPKGAVLVVTRERGDTLYVRFKKIPSIGENGDTPGLFSSGERPSSTALARCSPIVDDFTQYKVKREHLDQFSYRRSGVMFGALIVPFKFYLSGDNRVGASSTIAPFVGFRGPGPFGVTLTPIVSAGLGIVPVTDATTGQSETKPAWSTAIGLTVRSSKNQAFNAGILVGRDFLSRADRAADRTASKPWLSIYLGAAL